MNEGTRHPGRIAHLILQPRLSGAETLVRELASRQAEQWDKIGVIALLPTEEEFIPALDFLKSKGVEILVPQRHLTRLESMFFYRRAVKEFRPDCVFAHSVLPGFYSRGSFLLQPCPTVTVLHDGACNDYFAAHLAITEKLLTKRLAGLIAVNPDALDSYRSKIRDASSISHVIPNGISLDRFLPVSNRRTEARRALGLTPSHKVVLQVGRINRVKCQHLTIQAVRSIQEQDWNIKVFFAGIIEENDYYEECRAMTSGMDVSFLGARSDIPDLMDAADLLVMPSSQEAHSVAFLEALASSKPVIGSRISSFLPYEAMEGVILVSPQDPTYAGAIRKTLEGSYQYHQRDLSDFTIEQTCEKYSAVALDAISSFGTR